MKKKILTLILTAVCALCCAFGFAACGGNSSDGSGGNSPDNTGGNSTGNADDNQQNTNEVESVILTDKNITLKVGDTKFLPYTLKPDNAEYKTLTWTSSDKAVATVENGNVKAVSEGKATVTLTTDNGKSASCKVTVEKKEDVPKPEEKVEEIKLNRTELTLYIGGEADASQEMLMAMLIPAVDGADGRVEWNSSNESVVYVVGAGGHVTVVAAAEGTATVTAKVDGVEAVCTVTVERAQIDEVEEIDISEFLLRLNVGESAVLQAIITPAHVAQYYPVKWSSQDTSIATVDEYGTVTAVAEGVTTVMASAGGKIGVCSVRVEYVPLVEDVDVESVTFNETEMTLKSGEEADLIATVLPENATDVTLEWNSSDWNVAQVNSNGHITTRAVGTAIITATSVNGLYASCTVTVNPDMPILAESVSLNKNELALEVGGYETLTATVLPENAINKTLTWTSSDESVATVDSEGKVTAISEGEAVITAKTGNLKYATCTVTVSAATVAVESVTINKTQLSLLIGGEETLTATVLPANATDKTVIWSSSDNGVATVDNSGKVTAVAAGTATITVTAGDKTAECSVTVNAPELDYTEITEDGEVVAYAVSGIGEVTDSHVIIPSTHNGKPVTAIGNSAFSSCENITQIELPDGVTTIGTYAFSYCTRLEAINIPDGVKEIESGTFNECRKLAEIKIPDGVTTIGAYAFYRCENITQIELPDGVTAIGTYAFSYCTRLEAINIPDGVKVIEANTFNGCSNLAQVTLPDGVTAIGNYAFSYCFKLESINIPDGVTSIGSSAFSSCKLTDLVIPDSVTSIGKNALQSVKTENLTIPYVGEKKDGTGATHFGYIFGASSYDVQASKIPTTLTYVTVSGGTIAGNAFYGCNKIGRIGIGSGVTSIGASAFSGCGGLYQVKITDLNAWLGIDFANGSANPLSIAQNLNLNGTVITELVIPETIPVIKNYAFCGASTITSVEVPDTVTEIGKSAFQGCSKLASITLPFVGDKPQPTKDCQYFDYIFGTVPASLKKVKITGSLPIPRSAFYGCGNITDIELSEDIKEIGTYAFSGCTALKNVNLPHGITKISTGMFEGCAALTEYEFSSNITRVEYRAFINCGFTSIILPDSVTFIDQEAFKDCASLKKLYISKGVTSLPQGVLIGCTALEFLSVPFVGQGRNVGTDQSCIGWFFGVESEAQADAVPATLKTVAVTDGGSILWQGAFQNCSSITTVILCKNITTIYDKAFTGSGVYTIYYEGTSAEWNSMVIGDYRAKTSAAKYYYSEIKVSGRWHYDEDGITPVLW